LTSCKLLEYNESGDIKGKTDVQLIKQLLKTSDRAQESSKSCAGNYERKIKYNFEGAETLERFDTVEDERTKVMLREKKTRGVRFPVMPERPASGNRQKAFKSLRARRLTPRKHTVDTDVAEEYYK